MQLKTDLAVRKWKPKKNRERVSCGSSLYLKGFLSGARSYVFRAQPIENGVQKSYWVTIGHPATSGAETSVGGELTLEEARLTAHHFKTAIKKGTLTVHKAKKVIEKGCAVLDIANAINTVDQIKIDPVVQLHSYPSFDKRFHEWYEMNKGLNRWTHKDSLKRPITCYEHIKKQIGHFPITDIPRSLVKSALQEMFKKVPDLAKQMRGFCEEIFESALDDRLIDHNPTPPIKNFARPNKKTRHHGTIKADRLPQLYQYKLPPIP